MFKSSKSLASGDTASDPLLKFWK